MRLPPGPHPNVEAKTTHPRASELIATLNLEPHPEGGFYRRIYTSSSVVAPTDKRGLRPSLTGIYFLLTSETHSRWHQVHSDEAWHLYEGGPVELFEADLSVHLMEHHVLAPVNDMHQGPVHVVPAGRWQAARTLGPYALIGCSIAPGFDFADFRMLKEDEAAAELLREQWPNLAFLI